MDERREIDRVPSSGTWCYKLSLSAEGSGSNLVIDGPNYGRLTVLKIGSSSSSGTRADRTSDATRWPNPSPPEPGPYAWLWQSPPASSRYVPHSVCRTFQAGDLVDIRASFQVTNPQNQLAYVGSYVVRGTSRSDFGGPEVAAPVLQSIFPAVRFKQFERVAYEVIPSSGYWCYNLVNYGVWSYDNLGTSALWFGVEGGSGRVSVSVRNAP